MLAVEVIKLIALEGRRIQDCDNDNDNDNDDGDDDDKNDD